MPSRRNFRLHFLALTATCVTLAGPARADTACQSKELGRGEVGTVTDGRSFALTDGRAVKLAAIEVPAGEAAKVALAELITGKQVVLYGRAAEPDRYGRLIAFTSVSGSETPIQYALLARGQARVSGPGQDKDCGAALLRQERTARAARLGLWADPVYAIRRQRFLPRSSRSRAGSQSWKARSCRFGKAAQRSMSISDGAGRRISRSRLRSAMSAPSRRPAWSRNRWPAGTSGCADGSRSAAGHWIEAAYAGADRNGRTETGTI